MSNSSNHTPPKKWKLALLIWMFIFPSITLLFYLFGPMMENWAPYFRTMLLTLILVPVMVFVALPFIHKHFGGWLRK